MQLRIGTFQVYIIMIIGKLFLVILVSACAKTAPTDDEIVLEVRPPGPPVCSWCVDPSCSPVPEDCETGYGFCACCPECRGKVGDDCTFFTVSCESGLVCRDSNGVELEDVTWEHALDGFHGTCAQPAFAHAPMPECMISCPKNIEFNAETGEITEIDPCPALPSDCERERPECSCCDVCRLKLGEPCRHSSPSCETDLVCMDAGGLKPEELTWREERFFRGICVQPETEMMPHLPACPSLHIMCGDTCPGFVLTDDCEFGMSFCGCCGECRHKIGEPCDFYSVGCESGLVCRNAEGEERSVITWFSDRNFVGTCQKPSLSVHPAKRDQKRTPQVLHHLNKLLHW